MKKPPRERDGKGKGGKPMKYPRPEWAEQVISRMKQYRITQIDLALESGYALGHISKILCGRRVSERAKYVILFTLYSIIQRIKKGECKDG